MYGAVLAGFDDILTKARPPITVGFDEKGEIEMSRALPVP
jgi:hypothetical protein